ncbi:Plasmodium exported protein, unknown function [Plasmodium vivax]|uniref:Uncharacterized protein n=1 Tax=Plasmodium vivax TaxID=5855 RepID=A0A565A5F6_PLAVI|nr:Plasmodium exported protein, unknown function [Plasmodium vivax]
MKFLIFINIVTVVLVTLKYQHYNDENKISNSLENGEVYDMTLYRKTHRILAKYENQKELINSRFNYETQDYGGNHKLVHKRENNNTYEQLKRAKPNNMEAYLNNFKYRHSKKRGLKKLDCYCEKKLFSSLDKIEKTAKKKNNGKSRIISIICGKYGLPLLLLSLLPLFALQLPDNIIGEKHIKELCEKKSNAQPTDNLPFDHTKCTLEPLKDNYLRYIFIFVTFIIVLFIIMYTYIKINKYKRIKEGMLK